MGLKDVSKIVANQVAREQAQEEAAKATPFKTNDSLSNIKPGTNKPMDVSNHVGFNYDSDNPFHKDLLKTLLQNGVQDIAVHEGGAMSIPRDVVYDDAYSNKFATAAKFAGGEIRFGEATKLRPRKAESKSAPATRPTPPKNSTTRSPVEAVAARQLNVDQERSAKRLDTPEAIAARNALLRKNRGK